MKQEILNGTFDQVSINTIIDEALTTMFNPRVAVTDETKAIIRQYAQGLSDKFLKVIEEYNKPELDESYLDNVFEAIDKFVIEFNDTLNKISNKYIYSSVGIIWSGMFATLSYEFKGSPDWWTFEYANDKLRVVMMEKIKP